MNTPVTETLSTLLDYIRYAASRFSEAGLHYGHGTATALDEAAALVLHASHCPHNLPTGYFAATLTPVEREAVIALIERRIHERKPLAYLTGQAWFAGLSFYVDERVLVPRSPLAELIERQFAPWLDGTATRILDLCTGSGCIAIACAYAFPEACVDAVDISAEALAVAAINCAQHQLTDTVRLVHADLYAGLEPGQRYDLIVSNPPYVNQAEWQALPEEYQAEPRLGLEAGADGLDCVRRILEQAANWLTPEGVLVVEVGSSAEALEAAHPALPFLWLEFERGGEGVFLLTAGQLHQAGLGQA